MKPPRITFDIATADPLHLADSEIENRLMQVYVGGGFSLPSEAVSLFNPAAVRKRGLIIAAREKRHSELAGMVIVVPPNAPAIRQKNSTAAELHLLGVLPEYRGQDLGRMLIEAAVTQATHSGYVKLLLWTQTSMQSAQKLYESAGFLYVNNTKKKGRHFKVYERPLNAKA